MKIQKAHIKNFRCFEDISIEFDPNYTCLVGVNGSGKTTILEAIHFALSSGYISSRFSESDFNSNSLDVIEIEIMFDSYFICAVPDGYNDRKVPCNGIKLNLNRRKRTSAGKILSDPFVSQVLCKPLIYETIDLIDEDLLPSSIKFDDLPNKIEQTLKGFAIQRKNAKMMDIAQNTLNINKNLTGFPSCIYFGKNREKELRQGYSSIISKLSKDLNWRYRNKREIEEVIVLWQRFYDQIIDCIPTKSRKVFFSDFNKRLKSILSDSFPDIELSLLNLEEPFSKSFISNRDGIKQIEVSNMGSGIPMIVVHQFLELLNFSEGNQEDIIFLIDEPELHLHPQLQSTYKRNLLESNSQIVISTRSPTFIELIEWKSIRRLDRGNNIHPNGDRLSEYLNNDSVQGFLDEKVSKHKDKSILSPYDNVLLFGEKVLLVEGPGEFSGLPRVFNLLNMDIKNLTIISCNGKKSIPFYSILCYVYGLDIFTLFDLDNHQEEDESNQKIIRYLKNDFATIRSSFEEEFGWTGTNKRHKFAFVQDKIFSLETVENIPDEIKRVCEMIEKWIKTK